MKNYVISKSEIADELNVKKKKITYWTERFIGEVESSQGKDTMYSKEEHEKIVHVYLYRTLNFSCDTISKLLDENIDNNSIINDQISKIEENIESQRHWLNILKFSKLTGVSIVDIMNNSKVFGQKDYKDNLILYSYMISHFEMIKDKSMYNFDILYNDQEYLDLFAKEIAKYTVLLINDYKYDSLEIQNQIQKLISISSNIFGKSIILLMLFVIKQVDSIIKKDSNYENIMATHNKSIYYYLMTNNIKTIISYIDAISTIIISNTFDNNKLDVELEELYQYISSIKVLTPKGRVKIIKLFFNLVKEEKFNELFNEFINTEQYSKSLKIIYKYFDKKYKNDNQ